MDIQNILVPVDFSEHSRAALDAAIELAQEFDAKIHLLHSYQPYPSAIAHYGLTLPPEISTEMRNAAAAKIEEWVSKARASGIDVKATVHAGPPCEAILSQAERIDADLIALGTRGLTGLKHVLLGSIAERVVRQASCPVLTLKADT